MDATQPLPPAVHCGLTAQDRQRWEQHTRRTIKGWQLAVHEPWLDKDISRIVLFQSTFLLTFSFRTGNSLAREKAIEAAASWARSARFTTLEVGQYKCWIIPGAVAFTSHLASSGWVLDETADQLAAIINNGQGAAVNQLLNDLGGFSPRDHSVELSERLKRERNSVATAYPVDEAA